MLRWLVCALLALTLSIAGRARAEVPEHNPGLDHTCPKGFQYSRGPAACKQADCPAGAGRTYTYDCNCGEAWEKPFRTCSENGLVTKCVPRDQECDMTGKIAGGFFAGLGVFILRSTLQAAAVGSGPVGWGLLLGGAAIGYGAYLWTRGRPGRLELGRNVSGEVLRRLTGSAQRAVDALNQQMQGGSPARSSTISRSSTRAG
jgi:hypothetical protein